MKKQLSIYIIFCMSLISAKGQINVVHVKTDVDLGAKQGFFYSLPATVVKLELDVEKEAYTAGPYAAFADEYLGLDNISSTDYNAYTIQGAKLSSMELPDATQLYFVEIQGKLSKENKAVLFSLSESGLASGIYGNIPSDKAGKGSAFITKHDADKIDVGYFASSNRYEQLDTIIHKVLVDTVMVEKIYIDRKWLEKADEQKARDAADQITKIREARYHLLTGYQEIPYDAGSIKYMDEQLEQMENEYLSLFTGITHRQFLHYTFYVKPDPASESQKIAVFNFSKRGGIKPLSGAGGEVVSVQLKKLSTLGDLSGILNTHESQITGNHGFYYRIPVATQFSLNYSGGNSVTAIFPVNQFGDVVSLPPDVMNVEFHSLTGGVKRMLME